MTRTRLFIIVLFMSAMTVLCKPGTPDPEPTAPTYMDNFRKIVDQPLPMIEFLQEGPLDGDLDSAALRLPEELSTAGFPVEEKTPGPEIRIGGKTVPVEEHVAWKHFETTGGGTWIDLLEFESEAACRELMGRRGQWHSGATWPDSFRFFTIRSSSGRNAVAAVVRSGTRLFNFGVDIPFEILHPDDGDNTPEELAFIDKAIDSLTLLMNATARALADPHAVTWIPPAVPNEDEIRRMRTTSFVRLWSEVKANFVFLDNRPELDWERVLDLYLPRVEAARTQEEYIRVLQECVALLRDGHTWVGGIHSYDRPLLNIEPIEGRPIVTGVGTTPEMQATGIRRGMELIEVNGEPVDRRLERDLYPVTFASTPQDRDVKAFSRLLETDSGREITAVFADIEGRTLSTGLICNLSRNREAAPWILQEAFEYRDLGHGLTYVAVNTFGSDQAVKAFDEVFDKILDSKGLVIDIRENGGGNTNHGYAIIARLIDRPCDQTSKWRTREYRPSFRAWGREPGWHEGEHGTIQPRGERPFSGPVAVLIGPKTYSAAEDFLVPLKASGRAVLIGEPTGGSTGQPLRIVLYGTSAGICTKWDFFPDGTDFVGVGIRPDLEVRRTKADVAAGTDPVLAKAVEILRK
jgi:carboxyl-terminal processing protease